MMRRGTATDPEKYIKTRLEYLYNEKRKNSDSIAHMVLDKGIYELTIVYDLLKRTGKKL